VKSRNGVGPKATFHKRRVEAAFYDRFFRDAKWVRDLERIGELARREAEKHGLGAMDALHLAAAHVGGAAELITTEKRSKPIHRSSLVKVVYLYQSR
jgi:predicted nucleic acid-binding protein